MKSTIPHKKVMVTRGNEIPYLKDSIKKKQLSTKNSSSSQTYTLKMKAKARHSKRDKPQSHQK
jgi:hypothetical protein